MAQLQEQVVVTIAPDGSVVAMTRNIKGTGCLEYISVLEDMLEAQTTNSSYTAEYDEATETNHHEVSNDQQQR